MLAAVVVVGVAVVWAASAATAIISNTFSTPASALAVVSGGNWSINDESERFELTEPAQEAASGVGANVAVSTIAVTFPTWDLTVDAQAIAASSASEASVVYGFVDSNNYRLVSFGPNGGFYAVANGTATRLASFSTTALTDGKDHKLRVREDGTTVKAFAGSTYLGKTDSVKIDSSKVGVGSRGTSVSFDNLLVETKSKSTAPITTPTPTMTPPVTPSPTAQPSTPPVSVPTEGGRAIAVRTTEQLATALAEALPGDVITMADGVYSGKLFPIAIGTRTTNAKFRITRSGTAEKPIVLQGSHKAIIDGKPGGIGTGGDYGLHLVGANYWRINGIRVTNVGKGIMLDGSSHNTIDGVMVNTVGNEAVHFRTNSSFNVIQNSTISDTGHANMGYGEALYIGTDSGSWADLLGKDKSGAPIPDRSIYNKVLRNTITEFTAEGLDIKEASYGNEVIGNYFDGAKIGGTSKANSADSWIDIKGNNNLIEGNTGVNVLMFDKDSSAGFQTHVHGPSGYSSATNNVFRKNIVNLNGPGYGFFIDKNGTGNIVTCDNKVTNAGHGFGNITCTP